MGIDSESIVAWIRQSGVVNDVAVLLCHLSQRGCDAHPRYLQGVSSCVQTMLSAGGHVRRWSISTNLNNGSASALHASAFGNSGCSHAADFAWQIIRMGVLDSIQPFLHRVGEPRQGRDSESEMGSVGMWAVDLDLDMWDRLVLRCIYCVQFIAD